MMRGTNTLRAVLAAVLATALLAGCGGGGPHEPTDEQQTAIDATFADYKAAVADGDAEATCALIAPESIEQMGGDATCAKVYGQLLKAQGEALSTALEGYEVEKIEVADDDSIARMYFVDTPTPQRFTPSGSDWLIVPPDTLTGAAPPAAE